MNRPRLATAGIAPHKICLLAVSGIYGLFALIYHPPAGQTISIVLPGAWYWAFHTALVVGSVLALVGSYRDGADGLLAERAGLTLLAIEFWAFSAAVVVVRGWAGLATALFFGSFAVANIWRLVVIERYLRHSMAIMQEMPEK